MNEPTFTVGIDEAGRGPLAGPVAVGVIKAGPDFNLEMINGVNDSKQLSESKREKWLEKIEQLSSNKHLDFTVAYANSTVIDDIGIVAAIQGAVADGLQALDVPPYATDILLDGGLEAPERFTNQTAITKGDAKEPIISAASIIAKVKRDKKMVAYDEQYPEYGFASHKGYPTAQHYAAIDEHGLCNIHRRSYLTKR